MKKPILYFLFIIFTLSSCVRELGEKFTVERRVDSKNFKTLDSAYLYGKAEIDSIVGLAIHDVDLETIIYNLDSIEIIKVGYVYGYENENPNFLNAKKVVFGDTILETTTDGYKFSTKITGLGMDSTYYARSFVIAHDLRRDVVDTGYNQTIRKFRTLIPEDLWIKKTDFWGSGREDAVSFVLENEAYIFGGYNGLSVLNDTWKYNPEKDTWTQVASQGTAPKGRKGAVSFVIYNKKQSEYQAWVGLGITDPINNKYDSTFVYYTTNTNSWRSKYRAYPDTRDGAIAFTIQIGDIERAFVGYGQNRFGVETNDLYMYIQEADTAGSLIAWTQVPINGSIPSERTGAVVTVIDNRAFFGTGMDNGEYKSDFWMFDGTTQYPFGLWQPITPFPGDARANAVAFSLEYTKQSIDNKVIYVGTGISASGLKNDFFKYDLNTQQWSQISWLGGPGSVAEPRENAVGFDIVKDHDEYGINVFNRGFVGTGKIEQGYKVKDMWEYYP